MGKEAFTFRKRHVTERAFQKQALGYDDVRISALKSLSIHALKTEYPNLF